MEPDVTTWLEQLASDDVRTRVDAATRVRQVDLDDLSLLSAVLGVCNDTTALPDDMQPAAPADPFAEFFGKSATARQRVTVADKACERLVFTGVIGKTETAECIARALDDSPSPALVKASVKVLGETVWSDRLAATRALVPSLYRAGASMYEVVVRFSDAEHRVMVAHALKPYTSRAVNELLNHGPSKALMEDALTEAVLGDHLELDDSIAADILTLLVSWDSGRAGVVSRALQPRFPWAILVRGLGEPAAEPDLRAWLASGSPAPLGLVRKLEEALKSRERIPHFPLDAWMEFAGSGVEIAHRWRDGERCREVLTAFVDAWIAEDAHPGRGWSALEVLIEAGQHGAVDEGLWNRALDDGQSEHWSRTRFAAITTANPPFDGTLNALGSWVLANPTRSRLVVAPLLQGFSASELRPFVEDFIELAEGRPVVVKPSRKGLIHEEREGIDTVPWQEVVHQLGDEALTERLKNVLPYVRSA